MKRWMALSMAGFVVAGCKSNVEKLQDLRTDHAIATGAVLVAEQEIRDFNSSIGYDPTDGCLDSYTGHLASAPRVTPDESDICRRASELRRRLYDAQDERDLAERNLNRLLN